jgi:hypothetical protein
MYRPRDNYKGTLNSGQYIYHGIGAGVNDGTWQTFTRDLEADLKDLQPNNSIIAVNSFQISGEGLVDDIGLMLTDDSNGTEEDSVPPVITLNGDANVTIEKDGAYTELNATALDDVDGNVSVTVSGTVVSSTVGVYILTYSATDVAGNEANGSSTANVVPVVILDTVPPVITLNGDANITIEKDGAYTELNATALDDVDGDVSVSISGTVDTATVGSYTITYSATDSSDNSSSKTRTVNIENNTNQPQITNLTLSSEKTNFIRKKDVFSNQYLTIVSPIKVVATYSDNHDEEVTDQVIWNKSSTDIKFYMDYFRAKRGDFTISASLKNIISNELTIHIEDEPEKLFLVEIKIEKDETIIYITLSQKPISDVRIKLKLNQEDNVNFRYSDNPLEQEFLITPEMYTSKPIQTIEVFIKKLNRDNTNNYTIITEKVISNDPYYEEQNPEDIFVEYSSKPKLTPPNLQDRRGAIRGVPIRFRVTSKNMDLKYKLINPPRGMEIIGHSDFGEFAIGYMDGVDIKWDIPFDMEEKTYDIKVQGINEWGKIGETNFKIKVPKTTIIPTEIINNELIVTNENSKFYGMKMKAHNGDNISTLTLRYVKYADVWKKGRKKRKNYEYNVFVIDNMPKKLDIKLPKKIDTYEKRRNSDVSFYRYTEHSLGKINLFFWAWRHGNAYLYDGTDGLNISHKMNDYRNNGSKIFLFISKNLEK